MELVAVAVAVHEPDAREATIPESELSRLCDR